MLLVRCTYLFKEFLYTADTFSTESLISLFSTPGISVVSTPFDPLKSTHTKLEMWAQVSFCLVLAETNKRTESVGQAA